MEDTLVKYLDYYSTLDRDQVRYIATGTRFISEDRGIMEGIGNIVPSTSLLPLLSTMNDDDLEKPRNILLKYLTAIIEEYIDDLPKCAEMLGIQYDHSNEDPDYLQMLSRLPK